ncbi:hypothetical protein DVH24_001028 [Malus domestica]|uniref:Uncharacterized protein n=1 Tax=Malus domestica TaxID=3750 RepID=A0A498K3B4_MALDO|nr:hypothetical protein DVH24_001028 [Malus domestica]
MYITPISEVNLILEDHTNEITVLKKHLIQVILIYIVSHDTNIEPRTPQTLLREITVSSTTVSSYMSTPDTTAESHNQKRESVRRPLFIGDEQIDVEEGPSEKDFDQIPIKLFKKNKKFISHSSKGRFDSSKKPIGANTLPSLFVMI